MSLYSYVYERPARKHFRWWYNWAVRSRLQPLIEVARMLKRRFENIITYLRHRITNAASESINAKIQWVKYTARGFRNQRNFVHAIPIFWAPKGTVTVSYCRNGLQSITLAAEEL